MAHIRVANARASIWVNVRASTDVSMSKLAFTIPCYSRSKVEHGLIGSLRTYLVEPRTPELACTGYSEYFPGSTLGRPSGPGGNLLTIDDTAKVARGAGTGAGAGRTCGWLRGGGALRLCRPCATWDPTTSGAERERSASTHATRVHYGKLRMRA
eukprot:6213414-Pleurochrysis_carterae.AAC.8